MHADDYDVLVIGGGVNGCGIARDAAGRGYSVCLAEMNDLASGTSSAATKLIHGGLRYLEHYEFKLVRESLHEREILWGMAPHIIRPLRFILPHQSGLRPKWLLRLGLFVYDHIGGRKNLPPTRTIDLRKHPAGAPLQGGFSTAFEYSDCWADDARLVVLNAQDAALRGATIKPRTKVTGATRKADHWQVSLDDENGNTTTVTARMLINAAGPWADTVLKSISGRAGDHNVRLVKGSHIVVNKLFDHDNAYFFQNSDGRIIFAIPYEGAFTLIGTTDRDYSGDPQDVAISSDEITYLCEAASEYFSTHVLRSMVVWAYSGVRPLYDDGADKAQDATRDYVLKRDSKPGAAPLLNIFGGKLTTFRRLAEEVVDQIGDEIGAKNGPWTAGATLPGGDFPIDGLSDLVTDIIKTFPFLTPGHAKRLCRLYGTKVKTMLAGSKKLGDLGEHFGADLSAREVDYLVAHEWATCVDDILWRRTKLGLFVDERGQRALKAYLDATTKQKGKM